MSAVLGYTYADAAAAQLIHRRLRKVVDGAEAMAVGGIWDAMIAGVRNVGRPGIACRDLGRRGARRPP